MNPHKGEVTFDADGKTYTIRLNTNTICTLEAALGVSFGEITRQLDGFNFMMLRSVVRGVLGNGASLAEAGSVIDELGYAQTVGHVMEAYRLAYPPADDTESPRTGSAAGTGLNS